ncbi:hypothetical protein ACWGJP_08210 [Microbacterium sp. NPDC055903]
MFGKDQATRAKADRNDLNTAMGVGALTIGLLLYDGIRRIADLFAVPGAVTVSTRVPQQDVTVGIGDGADAFVTSANLVVEDVNALSVASLVTAVVAHAVFLITVAVLGVLLCRRLLRGAVFDRVNANLTFGMSMGLLAAALVAMWFENMGLNGVFAALGGEFDEFRWALLADRIPLFVAAIAVGALVIVFRRGAELQKDAEGLV